MRTPGLSESDMLASAVPANHVSYEKIYLDRDGNVALVIKVYSNAYAARVNYWTAVQLCIRVLCSNIRSIVLSMYFWQCSALTSHVAVGGTRQNFSTVFSRPTRNGRLLAPRAYVAH